MKLHPIERDDGRVYCGPAALMAVTGRAYEEVRAAINRARGRRPNAPVLSTWMPELLSALESFGYRFWMKSTVSGKNGKPPTLARWLRERTPDMMDKTYIVGLSSHFVVVRGRKLIDNHTKVPVWIREAPWRRARVENYTEVRPPVHPNWRKS